MRKLSIKKNELLVLVGVPIVFAILLAATVIFFGNSESSSDNSSGSKESERVLVEGVVASNGSSGKDKNEQSRTSTQAFFLKPSADEIIAALREADNRREKPPENTPVLKVMWPGYFFSLSKSESGDTYLQLDVDESGFGAILVCRVSLSDYPELEKLEQGRKIWVAGEVSAIDPAGTGSIHINVEYIRFDEGPPQTAH